MKDRNGNKSRRARLMAATSMPVIPNMASNGQVDTLSNLVRFIARRAAERDFAEMIAAKQKETQ